MIPITLPLKTFYSPSGPLSRMPGYEFRPQQLEAALAIQKFLRNPEQTSFALEAPTGVGKTFAVLVPALREARERGLSILFLTAGIALQEQLIEKDLPRLSQLLDFPFSYGLLKGRSHYACLRMAKSALSAARSAPLLFDRAPVSEWLRETDTGDLAELELPANSPLHQSISAGIQGCLGPGCPFWNKCFVVRAYRRAQDWDLVVANYHLYFSHIEGRGGFPLSYDWLVCDEAHRLSDAVRGASTVRVGDEAVRALFGAKAIQGLAPFLRTQFVPPSGLSEHAERAREEFKALFEMIPARHQEAAAGLQAPDEELLQRGQAVIRELELMLQPLRPFAIRFSSGGFADSADLVQAAELMNWIDAVQEFKRDLLLCLSVERFPQWAYWAEVSPDAGSQALMSRPVDTGSIIQDMMERETPKKVIFTSATLTLSGKLDFWSRESGIVPDGALSVSSPFDFQRQMEVLVVDVGLRVIEKGYDERMCRVMEKLCDGNGGRTLVLLSSMRLLRAFARRMKDGERPYSVLVHGDLPQRQLLRKFAEDETSILIGSVSFREGVDVPGEGLTQVIIDRIPFPHPNDPVVRARDAMEEGKGFVRFSLPTARMFLRQAAGRLIRGSGDHGRVVLLDGRAVERKSWHILDSFPACKVKRLEVRDGV